ncbi:hypothetical protein CR513_34199, partial [Mucuna pruriens]
MVNIDTLVESWALHDCFLERFDLGEDPYKHLKEFHGERNLISNMSGAGLVDIASVNVIGVVEVVEVATSIAIHCATIIAPNNHSQNLQSKQEERLLQVLSKHRKATGWTLADLLGINPSICMHGIPLDKEA